MTDTVNPPVYPTTEANGCNNGEPGKTLLDDFAGKAMQGLVTSGSTTTGYIAHKAYAIAAEMLKERERWIKR